MRPIEYQQFNYDSHSRSITYRKLFNWDFSYSCAADNNTSTGITCHAVTLQKMLVKITKAR